MTWVLQLKRQEQDETEPIYLENNLLSSVLQASQAAVLIVDRQGTIIFASACAEQILGLPRADLVQQTFSASTWQITDFAGHSIPDDRFLINQVWQTGQPSLEKKYALLVRSGEKRYVSINAVPLWSNQREMTGVVCSILDLSEQQRLTVEHQHTATLLEARTHQERLVDAIAHHIRGSLDLTTILQTTSREVLHWLKADRVLIYRFTDKPGVGSVVVEACGSDYPSLLGWQLGNSAAGNCFIHPYCLEQNQAIEDISQAQLDPACVDLLQAFGVKSQLVIPIFHNQYGSPLSCALTANTTPGSRSVWGLLIVHQCSHSRHWHRWQIELLQNLEFQLAVAIQHAELYQQVQQLNANLGFQVQQSTVKLRKALGCEAVVRRITDRVRDSLDEKVILPTALRELALALNLRSCHASFYNTRAQTATILYEYAANTGSSVGNLIPMSDFPELYQPLLQKQSLQFCPLPTPSLPQRFSVLVCPIADKQGVLGDLWLFHHHHYVFGRQEVQLAQQVATQCTIAIRQARLYQAAQVQVEELEKLNRLKDDFLNTISHELRTPMSSIKMSIQLLEMLLNRILPQPLNTPNSSALESHSTSSTSSTSSTALYPKLEQCVRILQEECDREIVLINDLLMLQQLEAGTHLFTTNSIPLRDWIPQVLESFQDRMVKQHQTLHLNLAKDLPSITSDLSMLNRVLVELLNNACKFTPPGGTITLLAQPIAASPHCIGSAVRLQVINTGVEIPPDQIPLIFNQFYRIPSNDPWKYSGTGLGLTLVKKMVNCLGGEIWADSQAGQTCLTLDLPTHIQKE